MKQIERTNRKRDKFEITKQNELMGIQTTDKITNNNRQITNNKLATNNNAESDAIVHDQNLRVKLTTLLLQGLNIL
jgi:hypothetical protein